MFCKCILFHSTVVCYYYLYNCFVNSRAKSNRSVTGTFNIMSVHFAKLCHKSFKLSLVLNTRAANCVCFFLLDNKTYNNI